MNDRPAPVRRQRRFVAEFAVWGTFAIGLVLLGAVTLGTFASARELGQALDDVARTRAVVLESRRLLADFREGQSERRAYLLTGDPFFLALYNAAMDSARGAVEPLDSLTKGDSAQQSRLRQVRSLLAAADSLGALTIQERNQRGVEAAAALVRSRAGNVLIGRVARVMEDIEAREQRQLDAALARAHAAATRAQRIAFASSVLAVLLVAGAAVVIRRDLRERRQRTRDLREATERATAATRAKSEFLASMSHEIRTPLNGVIGMTELALQTNLTATQRDHLTTARSSAEALLRLINDILDFSKIEAGRMDLESVPFSVRSMLGDTLRSMVVRASQKNLELSYDVQADVPEAMLGDPGRLQQVVVNLVGNAIKFTERGSVHVAVKVVEAGPEHIELQTSVRDSGIGIPKDRQRAVFELFTQADSSTTRRFGGTGLGLTISERLVTLMRGRIWVESEEGIGSTFYFTARLRTAPAGTKLPERSVATKGAWRGERVLVVEDNEVNQRVARGMLEKRGLHVTIANNGVEALEALATGEPFRLVFMDIEMPRMDGLAATRRQRAREQEMGIAQVPIVALTAHALASDHERFYEAGMDTTLTKPLRPHDLEAVLQRFLGAPNAEGASVMVRSPDADNGDARRLAAVLDIVDGDRDLLRSIAGHYIRQTPTLIEELRGAIAAGAADRVARLAHTIKGSSLQLGAAEVARPAAALEDEARDGKLDAAAARLDEIAGAAREFLTFLERATTTASA